jgi:hypothetical protein
VTVKQLKDGKYKLRLYHTWRGRFIKEEVVTSSGGSVSFVIPSPHIEDSHANYIGQDVAFILEAVK